MSEEQQRFGDGQDNYLQGAQKGMQAAKQAAAVGKTAEAGANAAAATVQGSVETGKAAANIAAGAAAGGPWGAILSAAWAMRNTLFKIVVFLCLSPVKKENPVAGILKALQISNVKWRIIYPCRIYDSKFLTQHRNQWRKIDRQHVRISSRL